MTGDLIISAMAKALSTSEVNASMGKIVAAPTAGASGIYLVHCYLLVKKLGLNDDELLSGLFTSAGIGENNCQKMQLSWGRGRMSS